LPRMNTDETRIFGHGRILVGSLYECRAVADFGERESQVTAKLVEIECYALSTE
jgi:hypothetical protein